MNRVTTAIALALTATFGLVGTVGATPEQPDRTEVMVGMIIVVLSLMAFLLLVYGVKWYLGVEAEMPPETEDAHAAHH